MEEHDGVCCSMAACTLTQISPETSENHVIFLKYKRFCVMVSVQHMALMTYPTKSGCFQSRIYPDGKERGWRQLSGFIRMRLELEAKIEIWTKGDSPQKYIYPRMRMACRSEYLLQKTPQRIVLKFATCRWNRCRYT
jgi:hypothetical protein